MREEEADLRESVKVKHDLLPLTGVELEPSGLHRVTQTADQVVLDKDVAVVQGHVQQLVLQQQKTKNIARSLTKHRMGMGKH